MERVQSLAAMTIGRVLSGRSLDVELLTLWRQEEDLTIQERGAIQDITFGVLRHLGYVDTILSQLLQKPLTDSLVRNILQVAIYQLQHANNKTYTIVDHAVTASIRLGFPQARGLVNGVLRNFIRRQKELEKKAQNSIEGQYSYPIWWINHLIKQYPEQYKTILEAGNHKPPLTLRVNQQKISRDQYLLQLSELSIESKPIGKSGIWVIKPCPVNQLPGFKEGLVSVQDAGAQLAAEFLGATDGMRVLDACAAPGGKTAHILELAHVEMMAVDIDPNRLLRVKENIERLGLKAQIIERDAGDPNLWLDEALFDRILLDVPCTASGVVRRHPDIKWLRQSRDIATMAKRQMTILNTLWPLLKQGGQLLYVTCSVFAEENNQQIEQFMKQHLDVKIIPLGKLDDPYVLQGNQLIPSPMHDGFYYAILQKI